MNADQLEIQESNLRRWSRGFPYPSTPDVAGAVGRRLQRESRLERFPRPRLAWAVAVLLLLAALMAVPPVRAQVLEFLQIGAIRIFLDEPTPTATPDLTPQGSLIVTATPSVAYQVFPSLDDLAGETSLAEAQGELDFAIRLPAYPADLGAPRRVFLQDLEGQALLLVWTGEEGPERIRMSLLVLGPGAFAQKGQPAVIEETSVNGQRAIWISGTHFLRLGGGMYQNVPLVVEGNILVWEQDGLTYRLESDLSLEETVKVAESLE